MEVKTMIHFIRDYKILTMLFLFLLFSACSNKTNILIITGGHDFENGPFFNMFKNMPDISYTNMAQPEANEIYGSPEIKKYDVLVFYDMVQEISDTQKQALTALLKKGKGMVFLHHSLASYQTWEEFENIIGGRYILKLETTPDSLLSDYKHDVNVRINIKNTKHSVTKGIKSFDIYDEVYSHYKVEPDVQILLTTDHPESDKIIGWAHQYKNSKIVYIQPGHGHQAFENDNYRQLVYQAITWVK